MFIYFANIFAMLGVAVVATAIFKSDWQSGVFSGITLIFIGAGLNFFALHKQRGK